MGQNSFQELSRFGLPRTQSPPLHLEDTELRSLSNQSACGEAGGGSQPVLRAVSRLLLGISLVS